jgi:CRAL/TRIO domain
MTSWPWMKDVDVAIAEPAVVNSKDDDRPSIAELIREHRTSIDEIKMELLSEPEFDYENKHDDLWILRFVLSHKKRKQTAVKAAKHTLAFRKEYELDERDIRFSPPGPESDCEAIRRYSVYCDDDTFQWTLPDPQRGVVTFIRYAGLDQHGVVANVAEEDWVPVFVHISEWAHQWLDRISRTSGRLTKNTRLVDLAGMTMRAFSMKNTKRDSKVMNMMEDCYPQLLKSIYVVNPPLWVDAVWTVMRPLMAKRVVEKFDIIHPSTNEHDRERLHTAIESRLLPVRFGGENKQWPVTFPLPRT